MDFDKNERKIRQIELKAIENYHQALQIRCSNLRRRLWKHCVDKSEAQATAYKQHLLSVQPIPCPECNGKGKFHNRWTTVQCRACNGKKVVKVAYDGPVPTAP